MGVSNDELRKSLNAPYGAPCFLTSGSTGMIMLQTCWGLNAPYGAPCFLTARRVAPPVTRGNDTSDRQGPKKHESDPQARSQISRLFVAIRHIATDGRQHSSRPGNSRSRRRVAPPHAPARFHAYTTPHAKQPPNHTQIRMPPRASTLTHTKRPGPAAPFNATDPGLKLNCAPKVGRVNGSRYAACWRA